MQFELTGIQKINLLTKTDFIKKGNMKILILGNIASGKSTITQKLKPILQDFEVIAIDDFRIQYGDGSMEAEENSKQIFFDAIVEHKNQIIEIMGTGDTGMQVFDKLSMFKERSVAIILQTPLEVCMERLKNREWKVPYPAPHEKAFALAEKTDKLITSGTLSALWKILDYCTVYETNKYDEIESIIIKEIKNKENEKE